VIVIDGSALVLAVVDTTERGDGVRSRLDDGAIAPHLVDAEVGRAVRGLVLRGRLDAAAGERSVAAAEALVVERYPHRPLRRRAWELRADVSFFDGLYVALTELTADALVTADAKLAAAHGPTCTIEVV
jgi:predicted nucleic acid-binding protein